MSPFFFFKTPCCTPVFLIIKMPLEFPEAFLLTKNTPIPVSPYTPPSSSLLAATHRNSQ